ncbi:MAG: low specificity L-threonine aldolase [Lentimicrobiaceae bacterium]|jgi:threonine aldolase|nr:low specificity L-threonine aldolase [Lentimicrobiaceae bacterium]
MRNLFKKGFASDNCSGVSPEIMQALAAVNKGHYPSYGEDDTLLENVREQFKTLFGNEAEVFFVFNGTGANVLSLQQLLKPWQAVVAAHSAHINEDETGAVEKFTGSKILTIETIDGKIRSEQVALFLKNVGFQHAVQPKIISISQPTELGTLYSCDEIKALTDFAHQHNMLLHIDGARIANAAVALDKPIREFTTDLDVDVLSFGGTKNGLMFGEAVVFLKKNLAEGFLYNRKQGMQLASKMRFITAQFSAYLENELWLRNAQKANAMAQFLGKKLSEIPYIRLSRKVEANAVFVIFPKEIIAAMQKQYFFHVWNELTNEVRLMCSFDTTEEDVLGFVNALKN